MNDAILDWSSTDNCILVDQNTGDYKLQNRTKGDLRLFIGELDENDFTLTVNSIQELDSTSQKKIRRELKHVSDERIIEGCKVGDPSSYKALYEKYGRLLQAFC